MCGILNRGDMNKIIFLLAVSLIFTSGCRQKVEEPKALTESKEVLSEGESKVAEPALKPPVQPTQNLEGISTQATETEQEALPENLTLQKPTIEDIQQALKNAGFYQAEVDGILGPKTKEAIKNFQAQNNLTIDGKVGPKTWQKLKPFLSQTQKESPSVP